MRNIGKNILDQADGADDRIAMIEGIVKSVRRFDSGYAIVRVKTKRSEETMTGDASHITEGMSIQAHVEYQEHPKYGPQYKIIEIHESGFANLDGLMKYLAGSDFEGLGKASARIIVSYISEMLKTESPDAILKALDDNPKIVLKIPTLTPKAAQSVIDNWDKVRATELCLAEIMAFGMGRRIAMRVKNHFGDDAVAVIRANPYQLTEVSGIGFTTADVIALQMGVERDSIFRAEAATIYVIDQSKINGHCYLPMSTLAEDTVALVNREINHLRVSTAIRNLVTRGELIQESDRIYLATVHAAEKSVADKLRNMINYQAFALVKTPEEFEDLIRPMEEEQGMKFAIEQKEALLTIINSRVCIITGGPGTGKSTLTKAAIDFLSHFGISYKLSSPTGMAAKRLSNATSEEATTIHRLLAFDPASMSFTFNAGNQLFTDCVLVDETSMVDIMLFRSLLDALESTDRLILIGDANQLPSVGAGNVLRDCISSGAIPVVKLQKIFRQAEGSGIVVAAHQILNGITPELPSPRDAKGKNCMFVGAEDPEVLIEYMLKMVGEHLPAGLKLSPDDIQVLTPMRGKGLGVDDLNPKLQAMLNPPSASKPEVRDNFRILRVGDRIMQLRNDYKKEIFNGFVGRIVGITRDDSDKATISVQYPDMPNLVTYTSEDWEDIQLAYATTVHKSQGSEYPCVVLIQHDLHRNMLQRNLLYTGLTRAKKVCVILGTMNALDRAVQNSREQHRNTTLKSLLQAPR